MLYHSIDLQVVEVHVFNLGLPMNRSFRKPKRFRMLYICANAVYNVIQSVKDISSIRFFCKDIHETLKYADEFSGLKKNDEIQKEHISLSLSLSLYLLSICRCTLIFPKGCACNSLSLFLSPFTFAKRFRSRSDPNGIQERMFRQLEMYSCAIESTQSVVQKPMRTIKGGGEFLSNTGPYPLKFSKLQSQHSTLGHHRNASETPFKGVSLAGR